MKKRKQNQGFSMAELLIVVAIIVVLAGVVFVGVASHMRSMTKLEYDGYAKEIFVAAQNHLTMAAHLGYPGLSTTTDFGEEEPADFVPSGTGGLTPTKEGIYYILVRNGAVSGKGAKMQALALPAGALADGKALGGSYIIRYHKESARILDVYYWMENAGGWAGRYNHTYASGDYKGFLDATPDGLKDYGGHVIGYYGGATAGISYKSDVKAPIIKVENGDVLRVFVTNPNSSAEVWVDLIVKGKSSGAVKTFTLKKIFGDGSRVIWDNSSGKHSVMLDDITNQALHFANLGVDAGSPPSFTPGEDLEITAVAYNTHPAPDTVSNVAYSNTETTNSLFESISKSGSTVYDTAAITHIRHLENLDNSISNVSYNGPEIAVTKAVQKNSLDFLDFKNAVGAGFKITGFNTSPSLAVESFLPVNPVYALNYDGDQNSIKNIVVSGYSSDAGLFGAPTGAVSVNNLMLIDFTISGTNAGALAGTLTGGSVANVIAYNSTEKDSTFSTTSNPNITGTGTGTGSVGGLIGVQSGGSVTGSAAAVYVHGNTAGGFIGTMSSGTVTGCYSGGHTSGGEYKTNNYNVVGSSYSGGFVGSMTGGSVEYSYSTCSVLGGTAGGFAGNSAGSIRNSYCTGLVSGTSADAFAGSGTTTNCQYFSIINPEMTSSTAYAFDSDTSTYSGFANGTASAAPYDPTLTAYYKGTYNLKTVIGLGYTVPTGVTYFVSTHYGDWPAPEIFFVNTPVPTP